MKFKIEVPEDWDGLSGQSFGKVLVLETAHTTKGRKILAKCAHCGVNWWIADQTQFRQAANKPCPFYYRVLDKGTVVQTGPLFEHGDLVPKNSRKQIK